ncbi:MAG: class I SAM-dependent methyltransferase [Candidatus Moranbacteria bacterium]|nr:class I SAM-dependent methyltransferase [Candidatus Moranbacteria bacterium]
MTETKNLTEKFLDPASIIGQLGIEEGCVVADFGCGPGYFTFPFAEAVGRKGTVYSFDILPHILESVESKAKFSKVGNIITKRVNLEKEHGTKLVENCVDWVILKDIIFQNKEKEVIIKEAFRILKPGGRALLIEWANNENSEATIGPDPQLRISENTLKEMFVAEKFSIESSVDAGNFHYAFVAKK